MATPALLARYSSRGRWKLAKHLQLIDRELMDLANGINKRLILTLPPRHGKSMLVSQYFPAWYLGMNPDKQVILSSYQADFASQFGRKARDVLDEYGETLFGLSVRSDSSAADRWGIEDHIGGMQTAGAGGPITGKGADCLIVDDPYKNWQEANSALIRDRMWDWWGSTARTRLEPGGIALVVHTRWHQDDLIGRLLQAQEEGGEKWRVVNFPAISDDGEALWPERYDVPALEEIRKSIRSQYIWEALYQQRPTPREGGLFRAAWLRYYTVQGEYLRLTRFDEHNRPLPDVIVSRREAMVFVTADTATKAKTSADYSVIATWLFHRATGSLALLDVIRKKVDTPDLLPLLSGACLQARAKFVLIEEASSGTELIQLLRKNNACIGGIPVKSYLTGSLDKVARSAPAQLRMESGMIYFPAFETAWKAECVAELLSFPKSINDDFVDNVSMAAWYAENHNSIHVGGNNASNLPSEIGSGPLLSFTRSSLDEY